MDEIGAVRKHWCVRNVTLCQFCRVGDTVPVNADKPHLWKQDIAQSVDFYNTWFMQFAPQAYRDTRIATTQQVESALTWTANLTNITPDVLRQHPSVLLILRMATAPPLASREFKSQKSKVKSKNPINKFKSFCNKDVVFLALRVSNGHIFHFP